MRPPKISPAVVTIDSLPDEILRYILSFVTTKEAVATSILSKRWINLWRSISTINFTGITVDEIESIHVLNESVDSVLDSREAINTFLLEISYRYSYHARCVSFPYLLKWIKLVLQHKLEHLRLRFHLGVPIWCNFDDSLPVLPVSIINCTTLVSLDLYWLRMEGFSCAEFQFPSLKTLHLEHIKFLTGLDFVLLLAGCPNLEDIRVSDLHFYNHQLCNSTIKEFKNLNLPKLTRADMARCWFPSLMLKVFSTTVTSLCVETSMLIVKDHIHRLLLSHFEEAKEILLHLYGNIPIFHNLTCLELRNNFNNAIQVLHQCPKLQHLKLYKDAQNAQDFQDDDDRWMEPIIVPQCFSSYLRTCIIKDIFSHKRSDHKMEKYILKNANFLQTLTLCSQREKPEVERKLSQCQKASPACQILVTDNI